MLLCFLLLSGLTFHFHPLYLLPIFFRLVLFCSLLYNPATQRFIEADHFQQAFPLLLGPTPLFELLSSSLSFSLFSLFSSSLSYCFFVADGEVYVGMCWIEHGSWTWLLTRCHLLFHGKCHYINIFLLLPRS